MGRRGSKEQIKGSGGGDFLFFFTIYLLLAIMRFMKKTLSYLPQHKQDELKFTVKIIRKQLPSAQMIILFGSYARNEWVEDTYTEGHITYEYISDFDILVLTRMKKTAEDHRKHNSIDDLIVQYKSIKTPVSIIYHSVGQVNSQLKEGRYFFSDIKREGIMLYDSGKLKLERIRKPNPAKRKQIAEEDFKSWFKSAKVFYDTFEYNLSKRHNKEAAFQLHQATERFYSAILLVFTGYKGKRHNIEKLGRQVSGYDTAFLDVFPRATKEQDRMFKLLKKAYIDARYSKDYKVTKKELEYLAQRVRKLQRLTKKVCKEKIESFV